ncbi:MAG: C25 family cysteine peptidase, partial [Pseudobdellovibrio sp.]
PELPVKSWLVKATPDQVRVNVNVQNVQVIPNTKPYPTQEQDCRCETQKVKTFAMSKKAYENGLQQVTVSYLGAFRGTPISRVDVRLGSYNSEKNETQLISQAQVEINQDLFVMPRGDLKDYLIVVPSALSQGISEFVDWKRSRGFNVYVETVSSPNNTLAAIQTLIKKYYTENGIDFAILVGDETTIPMFRAATSGSSQTPSDLKYFTMDGATDNVPDVFSSRIAATTADQVAAQLAKSIEFEQRSYADSSGLKRIIGIASNEGSKPSDDEYVKSIQEKFKEGLGTTATHLYQNDPNSKPATLNAALSSGALWLTYLGHGSGSSWPSMNQQYSVSHISQISNKTTVKPILIDVACQNGRLTSGYLGTSFMKTDSGSAFGAAAYYGGSVNISWHPPAVMARGIAFEHVAKKFRHLGEALLAGHLYLAANWNNQNEVVDNFEWYHLQGDPGMNIEF